ncbi:MAG: methyltransferase domain-containing protein [Mycobacteriales bacterium]
MTLQPSIGRTLISARSLDEYLAMFALDADGLPDKVLDCPGGAASFGAEARACGIDVTSVDPVYAADKVWLATHAVDEAVRGNKHTASTVDAYVWTFFSDVNDHLQRRLRAAEVFGADLRGASGRYVAAALPMLPFHDASFDLVLSSHLLFVYADRLDAEFHVAAVRELVRVCRGEVRIFPLVRDDGVDTTSLVHHVVNALRRDRHHVSLKLSRYEFQRGGIEFMSVRA